MKYSMYVIFFALFLQLAQLAVTSCSSVDRSHSGSATRETIVILGTNDIHGALAPISLKTREPPREDPREFQGQAPIPYQAGGAAMLASYIKILREEFGSRFLWLDAGDEFQGTIESNSEQGASMVRFFNATTLQGAAIGNHEFDYGAGTSTSPELQSKDLLGAIKSRMSEANYPYLSANIVEKATGKPPAFPNTYPHILLDVGRLKVGVIGLSTLDTPTTTNPVNIHTLDFTDLKDATLREAKILRDAGAHVVVLNAHVGLRCTQGRAAAGHTMRKPTDPQGECGPDDELVQLLRSFPAGTVDAVVSGHSHQIVHHWVAGTPVIQGGANGRYINLIYLTYDFNEKRLISDQARIEGPVPICPMVFKNQNDCNGDRPAPKNGRGPLVQPQFHGRTVSADPSTTELLQPVFERAANISREVIGNAAQPIDHPRFKESAMGNLVADAVRAFAQSDFVLVNSGGIRAPLEAGPITYGALFRVLPFENVVTTLKITGKELKTLMRIAESGSRGFPAVSGLSIRLIDPEFDAPSNDLDKNGKIEPWEINRLLSITHSDGSPIYEDKTYTLATVDFLVNGGDDLAWPMAQIQADKKRYDTGVSIRDATVKYIREKSGSPNTALNTTDDPLINPKNPRLHFEKPHTSVKTKKKTGKKTRKRHA